MEAKFDDSRVQNSVIFHSELLNYKGVDKYWIILGIMSSTIYNNKRHCETVGSTIGVCIIRIYILEHVPMRTMIRMTNWYVWVIWNIHILMNWNRLRSFFVFFCGVAWIYIPPSSCQGVPPGIAAIVRLKVGTTHRFVHLQSFRSSYIGAPGFGLRSRCWSNVFVGWMGDR